MPNTWRERSTFEATPSAAMSDAYFTLCNSGHSDDIYQQKTLGNTWWIWACRRCGQAIKQDFWEGRR